MALFGSEARKRARTRKARDKFPEDDPLHYLHVLRTDRVDNDEGSVALGPPVNTDEARENPGELVLEDLSE